MRITSRSNSFVKQFSSLKNSKFREEFGWTIAEGFNLVQESLNKNKNNIYEVLFLLVSDSAFHHPLTALLINQARELNLDIFELSDECYNKISNLDSPEGIAVIFKLPKYTELAISDILTASRDILVAYDIQDPGNAGSLLRVAEASGLKTCLFVFGCDVYSPKFLRASMGSCLRVNCLKTNPTDLANWLNNFKFSLVTTTLNSSAVSYLNLEFPERCAIVMGNEGKGLPASLVSSSAFELYIPMLGQVESLNVSVASGLILYQLARSRGYI